MTDLTRTELWGRLSEAGLVVGDPPTAAVPATPWPVRVMLGVAGWIGALFLLGFFGATFHFLFRRDEIVFPVGIGCCIVAYAILRGMPRQEFMVQFGIAVSLAGQAMILIGLLDFFDRPHSSTTFLIMAAIEALLAFAISNYIHRVFTTVAANFCLLLGTGAMGVPALATVIAAVGAVLIWMDVPRMASLPQLWRPLGYGFVIALVHLDGSMLFGGDLRSWLFPYGSPALRFLLWAGPLAGGLVFLYVVWTLRERAGVKANSLTCIATTGIAIIVGACGVAAPGISAASLVITLGFANGNRVLMGLGTMAFGVYLSHFYYQMSITLLTKSIVLMGTGVALLAMRWAIDHWTAPEEITNA